ncbi:hypothetical protein ACJX0J_024596 [Zea mays]
MFSNDADVEKSTINSIHDALTLDEFFPKLIGVSIACLGLDKKGKFNNKDNASVVASKKDGSTIEIHFAFVVSFHIYINKICPRDIIEIEYVRIKMYDDIVDELCYPKSTWIASLEYNGFMGGGADTFGHTRGAVVVWE